MADAVTVTTEPALGAEVQRWIAQLPRDLATNAETEAGALVEAVRVHVPVLTGTLAGSVEAVIEDATFGIGMGEDVPYAAWIEFGGSRGRDHVAQGRYVYPTLVDNVGRAQAVFEQATIMSIERFNWS